MTFAHDPVMVAEVIDLFARVPAGVVVDATVGGAGHAEAILDARDDLAVLGLDRDEYAVVAARERLARHRDRVTICHARFDQLTAQVAALGIGSLAGFLFDLGVSSPQIDEADRGFSYRNDGPLDMRMDRTAALSADDVVNTYPVDELSDLLRWYGDVRAAARVAGAIVAARPISGTVRLADVVRSAVPARDRRRGDPAKQIFQAIRIEVNAELDLLPDALDQALDLLAPAGRGAVLSYHSGEDRIVKSRFRTAAGLDRDPTLPAEEPLFDLVWRGGRQPESAEQDRNRRATSARLRAIERRNP